MEENKRQRIVDLSHAGISPSEITCIVGTSLNTVYSVRKLMTPVALPGPLAVAQPAKSATRPSLRQWRLKLVRIPRSPCGPLPKRLGWTPRLSEGPSTLRPRDYLEVMQEVVWPRPPRTAGKSVVWQQDSAPCPQGQDCPALVL